MKKRIFIESFQPKELNESHTDTYANIVTEVGSNHKNNSFVINKSINNNINYSYFSVEHQQTENDTHIDKENSFLNVSIKDNNNFMYVPSNSNNLKVKQFEWKKKIKAEKLDFSQVNSKNDYQFKYFLNIFDGSENEKIESTLNFKSELNRDFIERKERHLDNIESILNLNSAGEQTNMFNSTSKKNPKRKLIMNNIKIIQDRLRTNDNSDKITRPSTNSTFKMKRRIDSPQVRNLTNDQNELSHNDSFIYNMRMNTNETYLTSFTNNSKILEIDKNKISILLPNLRMEEKKMVEKEKLKQEKNKPNEKEKNLDNLNILKQIDQSVLIIQRKFKKFKKEKTNSNLINKGKLFKLLNIWIKIEKI